MHVTSIADMRASCLTVARMLHRGQTTNPAAKLYHYSPSAGGFPKFAAFYEPQTKPRRLLNLRLKRIITMSKPAVDNHQVFVRKLDGNHASITCNLDGMVAPLRRTVANLEVTKLADLI